VLLPPDPPLDLTDFLRRLSDMMTGGRNAQMLARAADEIESLRRRTAVAEGLYSAREDDHARNLELREVAELGSDNLIADVTALKAELDTVRDAAKTERDLLESEIRRLQTEIGETEARAMRFAMEMKTHLGEFCAVSDARIAALAAEVEKLRSQQRTVDETTAVVPVAQLRLARAQFDYLAQSFAGSGDVASLAICQIGACAIDKALGVSENGATQLPTI
jgi:chromosome segregation ATPase